MNYKNLFPFFILFSSHAILPSSRLVTGSLKANLKTPLLPPHARAYYYQNHLPPQKVRSQLDAVFSNPALQRKMSAVMVDHDLNAVPALDEEGFIFYKYLVENQRIYGPKDFVFRHPEIPGWIFKLCSSADAKRQLYSLGRIWQTQLYKAQADTVKKKFNVKLTTPEKFAYPLPDRIVNLPEMMVAAQFLDLSTGEWCSHNHEVIRFLSCQVGTVDATTNNINLRPAPYDDLAIIDMEPCFRHIESKNPLLLLEQPQSTLPTNAAIMET
jgi:hypothetical protein